MLCIYVLSYLHNSPPKGYFDTRMSLISYFRTSKEELEKVSWPSKEETLRYGAVVIAASIIAAIFFGVVDLGLGKVVNTIIASRSGSQTQTAPQTQEIPLDALDIQGTDAQGNPIQIDSNGNVAPSTLNAEGTLNTQTPSAQ